MEELSIKEIQSRQLELMKVVDIVCRKNNIRYYLISGSCLGAVRHKGFIPWDDDIDIAMFRDDYEHFLSIFNFSFDLSKFYLQNDNTEKDFILSLSRICILGTKIEQYGTAHLNINKCMFMDVFPLDNVPDKGINRKRQMYELKIVNRIMTLKIFYLSHSRFKNLIKKMVSLALTPIPLGSLKSIRYRILTRYNSTRTQCVSSMASKYGYRKHIMSYEVYGNPVELEFEHEQFMFPQKYEEHLKKLFGNNFMDLPPISKREPAAKVFIL